MLRLMQLLLNMNDACSYQGDPSMHGVFVTRPAMDLLWGYDDQLLKALEAWLPAGTLPDGSRVRSCCAACATALCSTMVHVNLCLHGGHECSLHIDQHASGLSAFQDHSSPVQQLL